MELTKQSLFAFQIFAQPLEKNFSSIEEEFKRVHESINSLKQQNESFKILQAKLQKLIDEGHLTSYLPKPSIPNQSMIQVDYQKQLNPQILDTLQHPLGDVISDRSAFHEMDGPQNYVRIQKTMSETVMPNDQHNTESILHGLSNVPQQQFLMTKNSTFLKQPFNVKVEQSSAFGKEKLTKNIGLNNKNHQQNLQNGTITEQINYIREKIQSLQTNDDCFKEQIELLERENDKFRKILGLKKLALKDKNGSQNQNSSRDSKGKLTSRNKNQLGSSSKTNTQQDKSQEQESKQEDQMTELQSFKELHDDIQKIRDYLSGKMKAIDSNFFDINTKIHGITRQIDIMERTLESHKEDIQFLERTSNQTKLNLTDLYDKSLNHGMKNNKSKKALHGVQSNDQGEKSGEKLRTQVEERIIDLFDEMERLKSEYQEILFGKPNSQGEKTQNEVDPQILEKRKKLALKFNTSGGVDEKMRKELSMCKRDLKKLRDEFDHLMTGVNSGTHETKTLIIKPNENKEDWKSLSTKMNKLRQELTSQVKELEGRITANNELTVILNEFEVGIQECKILIKKKLDIGDFEKTVKRIDSRLNNFIRQTFQKEGYTNEQDALIAKKPWFCLSCDVELKTYGTKPVKAISPVHQDAVGDKFVGKKVNPELHMVRRNENSKLPSLAM